MWKRYLIATIFIAAFAIVLGGCTHENTRFTETIETEVPATSGGVETPTEPPVEPPVEPPPENSYTFLKTIAFSGMDMGGYIYEGKINFDFNEANQLAKVSLNRAYKETSDSPKKEAVWGEKEFKYDENNRIIESKTYSNGSLETTNQFTYGSEGLITKAVVSTKDKPEAISEFAYADSNKKILKKLTVKLTPPVIQLYDFLFNEKGWPTGFDSPLVKATWGYENDRVASSGYTFTTPGTVPPVTTTQSAAVRYDSNGKPIKLEISRVKMDPKFIGVVSQWKDGKIIAETEKPFTLEKDMLEMAAESGGLGGPKAFTIINIEPTIINIDQILTAMAVGKGFCIRKFEYYEDRDEPPIMPPFTALNNFLVGQNSMIYMDQPDVKFGKFNPLFFNGY